MCRKLYHAKSYKRWQSILLSLTVALVVGVAGCHVSELPVRPSETVAKPVVEVPSVELTIQPPLSYRARHAIWLKIVPTLTTYQDKQCDLIWDCLETFCQRMDAYKPRAEKFANEALSWSTKWEYTKSLWSEYIENDLEASYKFNAYIRELFEKQVISPKEIQVEVERCFTQYIERCNALDNEMIIKLQADLNELGISKLAAFPELASVEQFQRSFHFLFNNTIKTIGQDAGMQMLRMTTVEQLGSYLAVRLATSIATRLGVSEVILGGSAASGVVTFGMSLVGGYFLDMLVGELLKEFADIDPERDVRVSVTESLEQLKMRLMGRCAAGAQNAYYRRFIDDLYGMPSYPEKEVKEQLRGAIAELERDFDMGLTFQLVQYHLNRHKHTELALGHYIFGEFGEHGEQASIGRYWKYGSRPSPETIMSRVRQDLAQLRKGGE